MTAAKGNALFLLNLDTWVTKESLAWLRETRTPVIIVNDDSAGKFKDDIFHPTSGEHLINIISNEKAIDMVTASCSGDVTESGLKLMTNGEAGYGWLRTRFGNAGGSEPPALRMLEACSDKGKFRTITRAAFPEVKVMSYSAASSVDQLEAIATAMRQPGTEWITKPACGFCAVGVEYWGSFEGAAGDLKQQARFSVEGLQAALKDVIDDQEDGEMLVETYLKGHQYTADGYFNSAGEVEILQVSWAAKDPTDPGDIREVVLGTDLNILQEQRPLTVAMMKKIQAAATAQQEQSKSTRAFFRNFPFMVEYRVDPSSLQAFPIEVNSLRHEGKSPAYASFIFKDVPLYDFFFKEKKFSEDLLAEELLDGKVAAMVFARKPDSNFTASKMDFDAWKNAIEDLAYDDDDDVGADEIARTFPLASMFPNGKNNFFGWSRGHFEGWKGLLEVLGKDWEKQFVKGPTQSFRVKH